MSKRTEIEDAIVYVIDEDNRTVTGKYTESADDDKNFLNRLLKNISTSDAYVIKSVISHKNYPIYPTSYTAKAVCRDDDVFDVSIGKKIVKHKIDMKRHAKVFKQLIMIEDILSDLKYKVKKRRTHHFIKAKNIEIDYHNFYLGENE